MEKAKIFFSYSRPDSNFALQLAQDLRNKGVQLWIDQLDIKGGSRWDSSIETALNSANTVLVILTPSSVNSNNVMDEVSFALESNKSVIPILLIQCVIPFRLRRLQYIDFTKDYQKGLTYLLETLIQTSVEDGERDLNHEAAQNKEHLTEEPGKPDFKKFLFIGIAIVITVITVFWIVSNSQNTNDLKSWNVALKANDTAAYYAYLLKFPLGAHRRNAQEKIDSINIRNKAVSDSINNQNQIQNDNEFWSAACDINKISSYISYQQHFPSGIHYSEAQIKIDSLRKVDDGSVSKINDDSETQQPPAKKQKTSPPVNPPKQEITYRTISFKFSVSDSKPVTSCDLYIDDKYVKALYFIENGTGAIENDTKIPVGEHKIVIKNISPSYDDVSNDVWEPFFADIRENANLLLSWTRWKPPGWDRIRRMVRIRLED